MANTTPFTAQLSLEISIPEGMTSEQAQDKMLYILTKYLTGNSSPLIEDYGPEAWGSDDEPVIIKSDIEQVNK